MKCSRCAAELPDSATTCSQCGASVSPAPSAYQAQPPLFSYLPAGTPPWPTTVPQFPSSPNVAATNPLATTSASKDAKPPRSARSVLQAIAVLLLIPIIGAAATLGIAYSKGDFATQKSSQSHASITLPQASPTANATPGGNGTQQSNQLPTPSSFSQSSDKDLNIAFKYPSDWQAETPGKTSSSVTLGYYSQQASMIFRATRYSASASAGVSSASEFNQTEIQSIVTANSGTNVQDVQPANPQPMIAGTNWTESDVTFTDSNGTKLHVVLISVLHEKSYYRILIFTLDDSYSEAQTKYIQPMLASVQFLS